ncbi:RING finger and CHY zinc finger domain-containing protein 1-like [Dendronephthya gigantea]|uniref:RING finger and CHY zinc finger domain-containing protein 1-like n=1 Tax=Dendronephthya gigantea TaxID=151771 RepID=UPI00106B9001|nr:RING finger and CHY zinc finger domain-containing protein 1-like [Dendronephthya gigantea]
MSAEEGEEICEHYVRKCGLVSPCCNKVYPCRLCHDKKESHKLIRTDVKFIECLQCGCKQKVSPKCKNCLIIFGKYYCGICRLFDDREKGQFHCDGCGICRVGGRDNYFHCDKCDLCLRKSILDSHKCLEKSSRNNCAICLEDIHTSTIAAQVPKCGHLIHSTCFSDLLQSGGYTCPTCNVSLVDMSSSWRRLDSTIEQTPMPQEYANIDVRILCRDCHKHSIVKFHIIALKCGECGSYNTSRDDDGNVPINPAVAAVVVDQAQDVLDMNEEDNEDSSDGDNSVSEGTDENVMDNSDNASVRSDLSLD